MKLKKLRPHSMAYIFSIFLGVMLLLIVVVAFLRFAKGNIWVALSMAFMSTLMLSLFLSWVDVQETEENKNEGGRYKKMLRRHGS